MSFWERVKRHKRPLAAFGIILGGGILALILFLLFGGKNPDFKTTTTSTTRPTAAERQQEGSEGGLNKMRSLGILKKPAETCAEWTVEFHSAFNSYSRAVDDPQALKTLQDVHSSLKKACKNDDGTEASTSLEDAVVNKFKENLRKHLEQPAATAKDLERAKRELEVVMKLNPHFVLTKSLDDQFSEKFGLAFLEHIVAFDKTDASAKIEIVDLGNKCNKTHPFAKELKVKDPDVPDHKSLEYENFVEYLKSEEPVKGKVVLDSLDPPKFDDEDETQIDEEEPLSFAEAKQKIKDLIKDDKPKTLFKDLKDVIDFDVNKYFADLKLKRVSIDAASQMSLAELEELENTSKANESEAIHDGAIGEMSVQGANAALADLIRQGKPSDVKQATYDAWKNSGFAAAEFLDIMKESTDLNELVDFSRHWHDIMRFQVERTGEDTLEVKRHNANLASIPFIYRGMVLLDADDRVEFEKCMKDVSLDNMRALARKIITSGKYSEQTLLTLLENTNFQNNQIDVDKLAMLTKGFGEEARLAEDELLQSQIQSKLLASGIAFDVSAAFDNEDPMKVVKVYDECISKAAVEASDLCVQAMRNMMSIAMRKQVLEDLGNRFSNTADDKEASILKNVIGPAALLIKSKRLLKEFDNDDLIARLKHYNFQSYEDALREKRKVKYMDYELYKRLVLIENSRKYLQHQEDFEYLREDFDMIYNGFVSNINLRSNALSSVDIIIQELKKDPKDQRCSFDLSRKKLICRSPEMQERLILILEDKLASNMLKDFCENAVSILSLPTAIAMFEMQVKTCERISSSDCNVMYKFHPKCF